MGGITFLMIARLLYDKGYSEYVGAAKIIKEEFPEASFKLLGSVDTDYPNHVPEAVLQRDIENGAIEYLGYKSDVVGIIKEAHCVVLPSYNEGLSRVLMEALALRKVIVTTDISGCRETVDEGKNGYLCRPRDVDSLVAAVRKVLALSPDEFNRMGEYAREKAEKIFDVKNVIAAYHSITDQYCK